MSQNINRHGLLFVLSLAASLGADSMMSRPAGAITWTRVKEVPATHVFSLSYSGGTLYAGVDSKLYVGANEGTTWTEMTPFKPARPAPFAPPAIATAVQAGGSLWIGTFGDGIFRSTDDGTSWSSVISGLEGLGGGAVFELVEKSGKLYAATGGLGVFVLDLATPTQWSAFNDGIPIPIAGRVNTLVLHGTMLVATAGRDGFVYRFPEGTTEWQEFNLVPPIAPGLIATDLVTMGSDLFVGAANQIFRSEDNAQTWTSVGDGIIENSETLLAVSGTVLFAGVIFQGNNHRIYRSTDHGDTWDPFDERPNSYLNALMVAGDKLFAARNDGLWWTPVTTAAVEETTWGEIKGRFGK
jgi:photosystem II stability/assembly factor-like uncharacterized protein